MPTILLDQSFASNQDNGGQTFIFVVPMSHKIRNFTFLVGILSMHFPRFWIGKTVFFIYFIDKQT